MARQPIVEIHQAIDQSHTMIVTFGDIVVGDVHRRLTDGLLTLDDRIKEVFCVSGDPYWSDAIVLQDYLRVKSELSPEVSARLGDLNVLHFP